MSKRTTPLYQTQQTANSGSTAVSSCAPLSSASDAVQPLFANLPGGDGEWYLLTTEATIFHPQGGGQPSDTGLMQSPSSTFRVARVRHDPESAGAILHCGRFAPSDPWLSGASVTQRIGARRRALHSRIHTAGHVLGLAVQALAREGKVPRVVDGKASHFPEAAWVECRGRIEGAARPDIQAAVDGLLAQDLPVLVHEWSANEASERCTGVPEGGMKDDGGGEDALVRVVEVGGAGSYPCGGTHLPRTGDIGSIQVRSIKRSKDITKITYRVGNTERTRERDRQMAGEDKEWMAAEELAGTDDFMKAYFKDEA